jgi:hypothetical protein
LSGEHTGTVNSHSEYRPKPTIPIEMYPASENTMSGEDFTAKVLFNNNSENQINVKVDGEG